MRRRKDVKSLPSDSSDDDEPLAKKAAKAKAKGAEPVESSSESDIENYLQPADKIDLSSPFFSLQNANPPSFDKIENDIFAGVNRLSDSDTGSDDETSSKPEPTQTAVPSTSKLNFRQLHEYTKKMEETKKHVEEYKARKQAEEKQMDILNLLAAGESKLSDDKQAALAELEATLHSSDFDSCSDSEKEGWEEVEERQKDKNLIPKEGLQITVEMPGAIKKKKGVDLMAAIKRRINRVKKENQVLIHKVHLLCWIAHGNYVSSVINSQSILAVALSLLPSEQCYPANRTDLKYLEQILKWYRNIVENVEKVVPNNKTLEELLAAQIAKKEAYNKKMLVYIFVAILRSLGIQCRLVLSFQLEPLRPPSSELCSLSTKNNATNPETKSRSKSSSEVKKKEASKPKIVDQNRSKSTSEIKQKTPSKVKPEKKLQSTTKLKVEEGKKSRSKNSGETSKADGGESEKRKTVKAKKSPSRSNGNISKASGEEPKKPKPSNMSDKTKPTKQKSTNQKIPQLDGANDSDDEILLQVDGANDVASSSKPNLKKLKEKDIPCPVKTHPKRLKPKIKYRDSDSEDDFTTSNNNSKSAPKTNGVNLKKLKEIAPRRGMDVRKDIINLVKGRISEQKQIDRSKTVRKRRSGHESGDSDYVPEAIKKKRQSEDDFAPKTKVKRRVQVKKTDSEEESKKKRQGVDVWAEVFLETEEKWISVDVVKGQVHCVSELHTRATHPVSYVVAWNNDNSVKDITSRYCKNFNTVTRRLRIDAKWWQASLKPFTGRKTAKDKEEDEELERQQLEKPLPTSIAEYKDHPLYVLKRHLLKFQAIYPPDAPTLGFIRKEPVYSRQCVYTLHSRDIWLKHAKIVKPGEKPYKIVKARPRWDKLSNKVITDAELEIFGPWQTEDYVPPTAENGVVPRNAFGNVELFKPCMLPKKTVHLKLPGLNKIAKRMDIDCASAIVGFDFHGGWSHPTYDGFVVCEEYADILVAAWELEQDELGKKEQEKIDKRVYGNWKKLIRGLLIRERLKVKYEFGEISSGGKKKSKGGSKMRKIESGSESE